MVEFGDRRVIGFGVGLDRPIHPRSKIVLISRAPAPDRSLVAGVPFAVHAEHFVFGIRPEGPRLRLSVPFAHAWRVKLITPPPTAPIRMLRVSQDVVYEVEKTRRIAFHQKLGDRILGAERPFAANVPVKPGIVHDAEICAYKTSVKIVSADPAPGGVMIRAARVN